jgi:transcriptional regulator with XRE-family HTH domain
MLRPALSLEDYRQNRYRTVEEFAKDLGVSASTYYRMLDGRSEIPTMRRVAARLGVPPAAIAEFTPPASPILLAQISAAVDHADQHGWLELDPQTLEPTGRRLLDPFPIGDDAPDAP